MGMDQNWKDMGEQILDSVAGALNTGDFSKLNTLVNDAVNSVVQDAKREADFERMNGRTTMERYEKSRAEMQERWKQQQEQLRQREKERRDQWQQSRMERMQGQINRQESGATLTYEGNRQMPPLRERKEQIPFKRVGSVANVLYTVFGVLGAIVAASFGIAALVMFFIEFHPLFEIFGALTAVLSFISGGMMIKGSKQRKLLKSAERYIQICGTKKYASIEELAVNSGKSDRQVRKELKKMMANGMFPEGHLDAQETCFILNDEIYRQYTETAQAFKMREQMEMEEKARKNIPLTPEQEEKRRQEQELQAMITKGNEYIAKLRSLNDAIPGEEITQQLSQLESLLQQIFNRVKEEPEQMPRMEKLMDYYLPTTVKLVEAYVGFEKVENPGQDIQDAKAEIQKTLDIINEAFVELLNNLFQDAAFDATTDAQVLQTMLAREGLRKELSADAPQQAEAGAFQSQIQSLGPEQSTEPQALKAPWES